MYCSYTTTTLHYTAVYCIYTTTTLHCSVLVDTRKPGTLSLYTGETGFSAYHRGTQHLADLQDHTQHLGNAFSRHIAEYHKGEEEEAKTSLKVNVVKDLKDVCRDSPLRGQLL